MDIDKNVDDQSLGTADKSNGKAATDPYVENLQPHVLKLNIADKVWIDDNFEQYGGHHGTGTGGSGWLHIP